MKHRISAAILTKNEEQNLPRCLESLSWTDEVVVADTGSTDRTLEIAQSHGCRIVTLELDGFGAAKQSMIETTENDWILAIDADEVVSDELREYICGILSADPAYSAYRVRRRSYYLGKLIRFSSWQRDRPVRLFDRRHARFNDAFVHETVLSDRGYGYIEAPLYHYTYPTIDKHIQKIRLYAELGARQLERRGRKSSIAIAVLHGSLRFLRMYLFSFGIFDGKEGFVLAFNDAYGVYLKYIMVWERTRKSR
jgi:(heptosyl)LPS beta-1,4-glucosyltransferase